MKKKYFTLHELLVVIIIIILMFVAHFTLLDRWKMSNPAKLVSCLANLNGLGKAMLLYSDDYESELYPIDNYITPNKNKSLGLLITEGYCVDKRTFICRVTDEPSGWIDNDKNKGIKTNYEYAMVLYPFDNPDSGLMWDSYNNHWNDNQGGNALTVGGSARVIKLDKWIEKHNINQRLK